MFRHLIVLFLILLTDFSFGQIVMIQTQSDATIGIDRKAWNGLGNTSSNSDGYAHDFILPARTNPCQQITGIRVEISLGGYTNNNVCPHFENYFNLFYGCTSYAGGATCLPATNLIAEPNYAPNISPPPFNFGRPLGSPLNPNIIPDFGDNLGIDIIPVSNPGCNPVTNGYISYQYTITVTVTVADITPTQPPIINCWDNYVFNTTACVWDNTGTSPVQPTTQCWQTATFNTVTCSWDVTGTQPVQPITQCWETATFNTTTCAWDVTGTQPVQPAISCWQTATFNTVTCSWDVTGTQPVKPATQCWETAVFNTTTCLWDVIGTQPTAPTGLECWQTTTFNTATCVWDILGTQPGAIFTEDLVYCNGAAQILQASSNLLNPTYLWSTGETTEFITVNTPNIYKVEITSPTCFFETRIFNVTQAAIPIIENVTSEGRNIEITTTNTGDFLYSLNGNIYQTSNIFYNIKGGLYTIYVRERNCPEIATKTHLHFYIPKYFTPNNDGINDTFSLSGIEFYSQSQVSIFNRYGKLVKYSENSPFSWNGTFNSAQLPSDDYWYIIVIDGQKLKGHFTLKR